MKTMIKMRTMTMTRLFTLAALALMGVTMTSCGDDDEDVKVEPVVDRMTLLTDNASKEWLFYTQVDPDGKEYLTKCKQDDVWTFKKEGELFVEVQETACYDGEVDFGLNWSFNEDLTEIIMSTPGGEDFWYEIIELSEQKLIVAFDVYSHDNKTFLGQEKLILNANN